MRRLVLVLVIGIALVACDEKGGSGYCMSDDCYQECSNGYCEQGETHESCSQDCEPGCGDGECSALEANLTNPCPVDCAPLCGNDEVNEGEYCDAGDNMPGDGCDPYCQLEGQLEHPFDPSIYCGNNVCEHGDEYYSETVASCPEDCAPH